MKVEELFRRLSYGELSNLSMGNDGNGSIVEEKHPKLIQYVNEALLRLHSRFVLKENDVLIEQVAHITNYHLKRRFAESAGQGENYPYIKDLPDEPFTEDVIKILEVHDSHGHQFVLNDKDDPNSLFTPQGDVLQVPSPRDGVSLSILYQARHAPLIDVLDQNEDADSLINQEIHIPFFLEGALQSYVAYKVYSHINGQENMLKSQEHNAAFEAFCVESQLGDLANQTHHTSHTKLEERGFV